MFVRGNENSTGGRTGWQTGFRGRSSETAPVNSQADAGMDLPLHGGAIVEREPRVGTEIGKTERGIQAARCGDGVIVRCIERRTESNRQERADRAFSRSEIPQCVKAHLVNMNTQLRQDNTRPWRI